ncbi:hypothetical protein U27_00079 [Candidatus Vecturithrix granuli]|uniref:Uncharacterized protein n=1 Tax=Vecturithrix granuli TaxID=1499967 RepID=A0A081C6I3_VECG1|nr:hypothetical protein U27_00079 [Candidatus Vecturithrix granuli]
MKTRLLCALLIVVAFGWGELAYGSAPPKVILSEPILIIETGSVRLKFPGADEYTEVSSSRMLPAGTMVDIENSSAFHVLCPDWSVLTVPSATGAEITGCPQAPPDWELMVQAPSPPWPVNPLFPTRAPLKRSYQDIIQQIQSAPLLDNDPVVKLLACHLYRETEQYAQATSCCNEIWKLSENIRDNYQKSVLRYQAALFLWTLDQRVDSINLVQEVFAHYQPPANFQRERPYEEFADVRQYFKKLALQTAEREQQAYAHHHAALLDHYVFEQRDDACEHARKALALYQQSGLSTMAEQIRPFLEKECPPQCYESP